MADLSVMMSMKNTHFYCTLSLFSEEDFDSNTLTKWGEKPESGEKAGEEFMKIAENSPKLIPFYSHRYIPKIKGVDDPLVLSIVGCDVIVM